MRFTIPGMDTRIIKSSRRSISIHVEPDGTVLVKAPKLMPDFIIRKFIDSHSDWIEKQQKKIKNKPKVAMRQFVEGEQFLFMGAIHALSLGPHKEIAAKEAQLLFPRHLAFRIEKELLSWYQKKAAEIITAHVAEYARLMETAHQTIYFSDTRSKWGSCSHDNKLQFNWRLIMAPQIVIRYVVIHELAHTKHKNHSADFWRLVARYNPSYKQQVKWLKTHGDTLVF